MKRINYILSLIFILFLTVQVVILLWHYIDIVLWIIAGILYFSFGGEPKVYNNENKVENKISSENIQSEFNKFKVVYSINSTSVWITDFIYARSIAEARLRLRANPKVVRIGNICPSP